MLRKCQCQLIVTCTSLLPGCGRCVDIAALGGGLNLFADTDAAVIMLQYGIYFDTLYVARWAMHRAE